MIRLNILLLCSFFLPSYSYGADHKFHLFILSGQSNMVRLDPEISFTPAIDKAFGQENIIIVKDAHSARPIRRWYKNWGPPYADAKQPYGDLYDILMNKVYHAIQDKKILSVTFVWMQGERDARERHGDIYASSLKGLIDQLKTDLNQSEINFVIGRLSDYGMCSWRFRHWNRVRDAQVMVAESSDRGAWVNTDDLNDGLNHKGKYISDDLHYSVEGYRLLGQRFADKAILLINRHSH